jgi:hypothetical protein
LNTRWAITGSWEPQVVLNVWNVKTFSAWKLLDHLNSKIAFTHDFDVIFFHDIPNRYSWKKEEMLNYSMWWSCSLNLSYFWFIMNQTIEEISIFNNSSHLEWRAGLPDTNFERGPPSTIPIRYIMKKNHIKIGSNIWAEMIFGWPTFKIICDAPISYKL